MAITPEVFRPLAELTLRSRSLMPPRYAIGLMLPLLIIDMRRSIRDVIDIITYEFSLIIYCRA